MKKIIICGCGGQMGRFLADTVKKTDVFEVAFGVDPKMPECEFKVYPSMRFAVEKADVIIDFSHHTSISEILGYVEKTGTPLVLATTGHTEEELSAVRLLSEKVPIFHASNMSLGIAVLGDIMKRAVDSFPGADIELVEMHHNRKADAPSGTCKALMEILKKSRPEAKFVFGREGFGVREKNEIGVHALRLGGEVGVHRVIISTDDEEITIEHKAYSRKAFAVGAINAAGFILGKASGLYTMKDYLEK